VVMGLPAVKGRDVVLLFDQYLYWLRLTPLLSFPSIHNAHYRLSHRSGRGEMPGRPMSSASRYRRMQTMWVLRSARKASETPPRRRAHAELQLPRMEGEGEVTSIRHPSSPISSGTHTTAAKAYTQPGNERHYLKSTTGQDGTSSMTATAPIVIKKVRQNDSLALVDVDLTGAESNSFSTTIVGKLPMPIKWKKSPQIHVSFLSDAPGERNAVLLLHFLERGSGQGFIIKRKVRGVATSPMEKPRPQPSKPPPGSKASNRRVKQGQTRARQPNKVQHL